MNGATLGTQNTNGCGAKGRDESGGFLGDYKLQALGGQLQPGRRRCGLSWAKSGVGSHPSSSPPLHTHRPGLVTGPWSAALLPRLPGGG